MQLTEEHISFIIKDIHYRGIVVDDVKDEIVDHICSAVEERMQHGARFREAYQDVIRAFGSTSGLRQTQKQSLDLQNTKAKIMIRNYLTVAFRNLRKHRFYSLINIAGLAIGIAACMIIVLYVLYDLRYDTHHAKADRIYRINSEIKFGSNHWRLAVTAAPTASALVDDYPEIESAVRFRTRGSYLVKRHESDDNIKESKVAWTDSTFFHIFTVPVIEGNAKEALRGPNSIAISKNVADKYFKGEHAIGETLILDNNWPMKVTAVFEDMPATGHFQYDFLIALSGLKEAQPMNFLSNNFQTYVLLKDGTNASELEDKLPQFIQKHVVPQAIELIGEAFTVESMSASGDKYEYRLMPIKDIHLYSDRVAELQPNSDIMYIYLFSAVAFFILLIACINFMNLATARSANRAKEVGVRKVMGSLRTHLVRQFLTESVLLSIFSFLVALAIAHLFLPVFNDLSQKQLSLPYTNPLFYLFLGATAVLVGLLAGTYPSFFLSAFKPVQVLKGQVALGMKSGVIRSSLVVFQFVISILLIIGVITVNKQLSFIQNKKIGFNKEQVIVVDDAYALKNNIKAFKEEALKSHPAIQAGTISGFLPVSGTWRSDNTHWPEGKQPTQENMVGLQTWEVDHDYLKTLGMTLKQGRFLSDEFPSDSTAVVLNETAVKAFNIEDDPIGQRISTFTANTPEGTPDFNSVVTYTIIGVVEDFNYESLKQTISPLGFFLSPSNGSVSFRFESENTQEIIASIEGVWKKLAPGQPFQYSFLDEDFARMYSNEQRLGSIFAVFAILAIIIACLGLFALTAFTAEQRNKEIGIRKVLGASVSSIVLLLSREFGKLILISFVIAVPLAWYGIRWWLENYTYKVDVGVLVYLQAGIAATIIAWLTMSYQSIKAALTNPVNSLKNE